MQTVLDYSPIGITTMVFAFFLLKDKDILFYYAKPKSSENLDERINE